MAIAWLSSCCLECLSRCHRKVVCAQILKLAKLWHPSQAGLVQARTRPSHIKCSQRNNNAPKTLPKPAPSADTEREWEREEGGGIWRVFILPADDGRGSTFYEAVKKLSQQTKESGEGRGEGGQTCNFLARSSSTLLLRPLTLTQVQGRRQRARTGKGMPTGTGRGGRWTSCRP